MENHLLVIGYDGNTFKLRESPKTLKKLTIKRIKVIGVSIISKMTKKQNIIKNVVGDEFVNEFVNEFVIDNECENDDNESNDNNIDEYIDDSEEEIDEEVSEEIEYEDELWKVIPEYEKYMVSNYGRVKNIFTDHVHKPGLRSGYESVHLIGKNEKSIKIHRLVAFAFVKNDDPAIKKFVDHKDGNRLNNKADNLEWVTLAENTRRGYITGANRVTERPVKQYTLKNVFVKEYKTMSDAAVQTNIDCGSISRCCKGERYKAGGFTWKFSQINPNEFNKKTFDWSGYRQIEGFPFHYVNEKGDIASKKFGKLMKQQKHGDGYMQVTLLYNKNKKTQLIHRIVAKAFIPNTDPEKDQVNHKNSKRTDNRVENLEWVSNQGNCQHAADMKKAKKAAEKKESETHQTPKSLSKDNDGSGAKSEVLVSKKISSNADKNQSEPPKVILTAKRAVKKVDNTVLRVRRA